MGVLIGILGTGQMVVSKFWMDNLSKKSLWKRFNVKRKNVITSFVDQARHYTRCCIVIDIICFCYCVWMLSNCSESRNCFLVNSTSELFLDKPHLPKLVGRSESMKTPVSLSSTWFTTNVWKLWAVCVLLHVYLQCKNLFNEQGD